MKSGGGQKRGRGRPPRKNGRGDTKLSKVRRMRGVNRQSRASQKAKRDAMKSDAVYDDDNNLANALTLTPVSPPLWETGHTLETIASPALSPGRGFAHFLCLGILTAPLLPSFVVSSQPGSSKPSYLNTMRARRRCTHNLRNCNCNCT
jgi:hypothetical protein